MPKLTLSDVVVTNTETTKVGTINANSTLIEEAFENTLSRDGSTPNEMEADLDMNGNQILNVPAPVNPGDLVRKLELDEHIDEIEASLANAQAQAAAATAQAALAEGFAEDAEENAIQTAADVATVAAQAALANNYKSIGTITVDGVDVVADQPNDTFTFVEGVNMAISVDAPSKTITLAATGTLGATVGDGDYGDIIISASGTVFTIPSDVITSAGRALLDDADAAAQRTTLGLGTSAVLAEATAAEYQANTADKVLTTDQVWDAAAPEALTPGTNVSVDMGTAFNFTLAMGGNYTLSNPTNAKPGQSGMFIVTQDGTGSRTLAFGSNYKFAGGTDFVLSTAAGSKDLIIYFVESSSVIHMLSILKAMS